MSEATLVQQLAGKTKGQAKIVEHRTMTVQVRYAVWAIAASFVAGFALSSHAPEEVPATSTVVTQPASAEGKAPAP